MVQARPVAQVQQNPPRNERPVQVSQPASPPPTAQRAPTQQSSTNTSTYNNGSQATYHKVAPGETLYALSKRYNVTVDQLRQWNNLDSNSILSVGQQLVIRK